MAKLSILKASGFIITIMIINFKSKLNSTLVVVSSPFDVLNKEIP